MTKAAHTPGPWVADFGEAFHIRPPEGGTLAQVTFLKGRGGLGGRRDADECAANARLIAAAPDLLEALEAMLSHSDGWDVTQLRKRWGEQVVNEILTARAAIAKAKGEA